MSILSVLSMLPICLLLLSATASFSENMFRYNPVQIVDEAEQSAHATVIYRDCTVVPSWDHVTDKNRLEASWTSTYAIAKQYLSDPDRVKRALQLEAVLTNNLYSTHATPEQVIEVLKPSELVISIDSGAAYSVKANQNAPAAVVVDSALIQRACEDLMPKEAFDDLRRSAQEISQAGIDKMPDTIKVLRTETLRRANEFLIQSIRYESLKLFVLAHEATHLSFDTFSPDLLAAKGYQGKTDCVTAMHIETRADIVGESAVRNLPITTISEEVRDHSEKYSEAQLLLFSELAAKAAYKDQLTLIEKTKEWLSYTSCLFSPEQRMGQLDVALAHDVKRRIPK